MKVSSILAMLSTLFVSSYSLSAMASQKSICGIDDRLPSSNPTVGRLLETKTSRAGCTVTMISKVCAVSAGHCHGTFGVAEFNTPPSKNGKIQHPGEEDIYPVLKKESEWVNGGIGNDWAVLRIGKNPITNQYAGATQGTYEVDFEMPMNNDIIRITGYGSDHRDSDRHFAQQTHTGEIVRISNGSISHIADTMGGNSGSSIIRETDQKIIGIHTHGGCSSYSSSSSNSATLISENERLVNAIRTCLAEEAAGIY